MDPSSDITPPRVSPDRRARSTWHNHALGWATLDGLKIPEDETNRIFHQKMIQLATLQETHQISQLQVAKSICITFWWFCFSLMDSSISRTDVISGTFFMVVTIMPSLPDRRDRIDRRCASL
jgi:hypothetical protein